MTEITPKYQGARFYKCALQVNPWAYVERHGGTTSFNSEEEYNAAIAESCIANNIKVVGLADHGSVDTSESLRAKLRERGITVFPGFELASSEKIHMVCLYPEGTAQGILTGYLGRLMGGNYNQLQKEVTTPSSLSCENMAEIINQQQGFWFAAHMTGKNGLLRLSGTGDNYVDLWKKESLVIAGQIHSTLEHLEENDPQGGGTFAKIIRNDEKNYQRKKPIAIINAKDVKAPEHLGEHSASCLIKMTKPNFEAFKNAFNDPESRIRLNYDLNESPHSYIDSIQWAGAGYFRENALSLSNHLNTFIGGRGTGKTTLLESIRYALGLEQSVGGTLLKENLSDTKITLNIVSKTQNQGKYVISRRYGQAAPVIEDADGEISNLEVRDLLPEINILGQNEILKIEQDENAKMNLVGKFLPDITQHDKKIATLQRQLAENRERILKAQQQIDSLEAHVSRESGLKERLKQYKDRGIEDKLKNVKFLAAEARIRQQADGQLNNASRWLGDYPAIFDLSFLEQGIENMPNVEIIMQQVKPLLIALKDSLDGLQAQAKEQVDKKRAEYNSICAAWEQKSERIRDELNAAIAQLPDQAGKSGVELGKEYRRIHEQLSAIEAQKKQYELQKEIISSAKKERARLLEQYRTAAFDRFTSMKHGIGPLNERLADKVRIKVESMKNRQALKDFLRGMDGIGESKIRWLQDVDAVDLVQWSKWIESKDADAFMTAYKNAGLTRGVVGKLMDMGDDRRLRMEEIELEDTIEIELNVAHEGGKVHYVPIEKLSTGQKCTAILNLLLLNQEEPLIIDQPEDNLDNAFIAERIVQSLRTSKTKRQFLFATHNANIPVFGDAELIAVLANSEGAGVVQYQGSIDDSDVKIQAAQILEGGEEAFNIRKNKYGF